MRNKKGILDWLKNAQKEYPLLFLVIVVLILYHVFGASVRRGILGFLGIENENYKNSIDMTKEAKKSSLTDIQAKSLADRLFDAMKYSGTDEEVIYSVFKGLTKEDFAKVYTAFGTRAYAPAFGESSSSWLPWATVADLIYWLNSELNESEKQKLRSVNPNIPI